jgi:hypothetical protein
LNAEIAVGYGHLDLQRISLAPSFAVKKVLVTLDGKDVAAEFKQVERGLEIMFKNVVRVKGTLGMRVS